MRENGVFDADVTADVSLADVLAELRRLRRAVAGTQAELIDAGAAAALFGVSRATFFRLVSAGKVTKPLTVGAGCKRWRRSELSKLIEQWDG